MCQKVSSKHFWMNALGGAGLILLELRLDCSPGRRYRSSPVVFTTPPSLSAGKMKRFYQVNGKGTDSKRNNRQTTITRACRSLWNSVMWLCWLCLDICHEIVLQAPKEGIFPDSTSRYCTRGTVFVDLPATVEVAFFFWRSRWWKPCDSHIYP